MKLQKLMLLGVFISGTSYAEINISGFASINAGKVLS